MTFQDKKIEYLKNKTVLLRVDFNEPVENNILQNTKRIDAAICTIQELLSRKNKIILISHHGQKEQSLLPVFLYLKKTFGEEIDFINSVEQNVIKEYFNLNDFKNNQNNKSIVLLENTRLFFDDNLKEEKKINLDESGDKDFAKFLSELAEYFVFDAFSVAHRDHASVTGISKYLPHTLGPIAKKELEALSKILNPEMPELIILAGAKLSTKLPLVEKFLERGADVFLGGAMAHPILKERGVDIRNSFTESLEELELNKEIINSKNILLPEFFVWDKETSTQILDLDFEKEKILQDKIKNAKTILWNGPLGVYEKGYKNGTENLIKILNQKNNKEAEAKFIVAGGGDTLTVLENYPDFSCSYISLSGGAMLEFLAKGHLIGIDANK